MTRSFLKGLTIAAALTLVAQTAWSVDPRMATNSGRIPSIPTSNDPAARSVQPVSAQQITSNLTRNRMLVPPDPTRFEYNPSRPAPIDNLRPSLLVRPNPSYPNVGW